MQPKTINILYWIFTIIFAGLMIFSSYGSIIGDPKAKELIHDQLGYTEYFITFTGYMKILGSIVILIPGLRTIKEWAYAGFFFIMTGAMFSHIAVGSSISEFIP